MSSKFLKLLAGVLLVALTGLTVSALVWAVADSIWLVYPDDRLECPSGSQRWGRFEAGHLTYQCFELKDQKGWASPVPRVTGLSTR